MKIKYILFIYAPAFALMAGDLSCGLDFTSYAYAVGSNFYLNLNHIGFGINLNRMYSDHLAFNLGAYLVDSEQFKFVDQNENVQTKIFSLAYYVNYYVNESYRTHRYFFGLGLEYNHFYDTYSNKVETTNYYLQNKIAPSINFGVFWRVREDIFLNSALGFIFNNSYINTEGSGKVNSLFLVRSAISFNYLF